MAQSDIANCPTGVTPADADTTESVKRQFPDLRFVKSIQIIPESEYASTSA